jgi:hypothetical protein
MKDLLKKIYNYQIKFQQKYKFGGYFPSVDAEKSTYLLEYKNFYSIHTKGYGFFDNQIYTKKGDLFKVDYVYIGHANYINGHIIKKVRLVKADFDGLKNIRFLYKKDNQDYGQIIQDSKKIAKGEYYDEKADSPYSPEELQEWNETISDLQALIDEGTYSDKEVDEWKKTISDLNDLLAENKEKDSDSDEIKKIPKRRKFKKLIGAVGKSGTQYGYTLKEWEEMAKKMGLLVSPTEYWKSREGKKYLDFLGRTQYIGRYSSDKENELNGYAYRIAIGMDLGSSIIPTSAKRYVIERGLEQ